MPPRLSLKNIFNDSVFKFIRAYSFPNAWIGFISKAGLTIHLKQKIKRTDSTNQSTDSAEKR